MAKKRKNDGKTIGFIFNLALASVLEVVLSGVVVKLKIKLTDKGERSPQPLPDEDIILPILHGNHDTAAYGITYSLRGKNHIYFMQEEEFVAVKDFAKWATVFTGTQFVYAKDCEKIFRHIVNQRVDSWEVAHDYIQRYHEWGVQNLDNRRRIVCVRDFLKSFQMTRMLQCSVCQRDTKIRKIVVYSKEDKHWQVSCRRCRVRIEEQLKALNAQRTERLLQQKQKREEMAGWRESSAILKSIKKMLKEGASR